MGWLNWSPDVAYKTDVNVIMIALEGKDDFLVATGVFRAKRKKPTKKEVAAKFRRFVEEHNRTFKVKKPRGK